MQAQGPSRERYLYLSTRLDEVGSKCKMSNLSLKIQVLKHLGWGKLGSSFHKTWQFLFLSYNPLSQFFLLAVSLDNIENSFIRR